jgi:hypothetical protein
MNSFIINKDKRDMMILILSLAIFYILFCSQAPRDCNRPPCRHPVTGEINCDACPECCQNNAPIEGWQGGLAIFLCVLFFIALIEYRSKKTIK